MASDKVEADAELPAWLLELSKPVPAADREIPWAFMLVWGSISTIALGGGTVMGFRAFEDTVAFEALDKMEKPTPKAEKQAARMAMRAFGWGTALAVGSAAAMVAAAQYLGIRTAADVGTTAKARLAPFDNWLQRHGDGMVTTGRDIGRALDVGFESAGEWWRGSFLGRAFRGRVEQVVAPF